MKLPQPSNLSATDMLGIWEQGAAWHSLDQSLLVLQYASPEGTAEELSRWTLGRRDRRLLEIRRNTFGNRIQGYAECPACQGDYTDHQRIADRGCQAWIPAFAGMTALVSLLRGPREAAPAPPGLGQ